jgi:hypothetical protein
MTTALAGTVLSMSVMYVKSRSLLWKRASASLRRRCANMVATPHSATALGFSKAIAIAGSRGFWIRLMNTQDVMPQLTRMAADNSRSSVLYKCVKCGQRYQGIASQVESQKCICGGELKAVRKILKLKGSA